MDFNEDLLETLISSSSSMATNLSFKSMYFGFDSKGFTLLVSLSNLTFFVSLVKASVELYPRPVLSPDILWALINFLSDLLLFSNFSSLIILSLSCSFSLLITGHVLHSIKLSLPFSKVCNLFFSSSI